MSSRVFKAGRNEGTLREPDCRLTIIWTPILCVGRADYPFWTGELRCQLNGESSGGRVVQGCYAGSSALESMPIFLELSPRMVAGGPMISFDRSPPAPARDAVLATLGEYIREIGDPDNLAYAAAELLGRALNVSRAGYGIVDTRAETITINRDWNAPGIQSLAGTLHFRDYGSYIEDLKRGELVVCADADQDPRVGQHAKALENISARALVNVPISEPDGVVALLYLNNAGPRAWAEAELDLIREVAERTRTAVERRRAETKVRENEARLRFLDELGMEAASSRSADEVLAITTRML